VPVDGCCDLIDRRHAVHALEHAFAGVIAGKRGRLGAIGRKPPPQHVRIVVGTRLFSARGHFGDPLFDASKEKALIDLEFNHRIQPEATLSQQAIERLGLRNRAREPVKHKAALGVRPIDPFGNDRNHHVVGNQFAAVHDALGAQADRGAGSDGRAQHVAGRQLNNPVLGDQALRLRALPRPRRAEQNQPHRIRPRNFERLIRPSYWCASR
jgi:hypothetical protein